MILLLYRLVCVHVFLDQKLSKPANSCVDSHEDHDEVSLPRMRTRCVESYIETVYIRVETRRPACIF